jgi:hypothetical protein
VVVSPWAASALSPLEILGWRDPAQHGNGFFFLANANGKYGLDLFERKPLLPLLCV